MLPDAAMLKGLADPGEPCGSAPHCRAMCGHCTGSPVSHLSLLLSGCLLPTGAEHALLSAALNDAVGASAAAPQSAHCGFRLGAPPRLCT